MLDKLKSAFGNLSVDRFKEKLGGVPIWVWGVVLGLIVGIALYIYRKKNGSAAPTTEDDGTASLFDQAEAEQVAAASTQASYAQGLADAVVGGSGTSAVAGSGSGGGYSGGYGGGAYTDAAQATTPSPASPQLKVGLASAGVTKSVFAGASGKNIPGVYSVPGPSNPRNADGNPFNDSSASRGLGANVPAAAKEGLVSSKATVSDSVPVGSTKTMVAAAPAPVAAPAAKKGVTVTSKKTTPAATPAKKGISGTSSGSVKKGL